MGWDAYAGDNVSRSVPRPAQVRKFAEAARALRKRIGGVDCMLQSAGLDVSTSGEMLKKATGKSVHSEGGWSPREVRAAALLAKWDFAVDPEDVSAWESARLFLRLSSELGLGIWFSW